MFEFREYQELTAAEDKKMGKLKVKIFKSENTTSLEGKINEFIENNDITVQGPIGFQVESYTRHSSTHINYCALLTYTINEDVCEEPNENIAVRVKL